MSICYARTLTDEVLESYSAARLQRTYGYVEERQLDIAQKLARMEDWVSDSARRYRELCLDEFYACDEAMERIKRWQFIKRSR